MTLDHKVCTFVVNCICRKFFLDERPTISLKHYFFSCVSVSILILLFFWKLNNWSILFIIFLCHQVVFMSDSDDYSYIERCFNGAASVLPLPLCELLICISLNNVPIAHPWIFMPIFFLFAALLSSVILWALVLICCWFEAKNVSISWFLFLQGWWLFSSHKKETCKFMTMYLIWISSWCNKLVIIFDVVWYCLFRYPGFVMHGICLLVLMLIFNISRLRTLVFPNRAIRMFMFLCFLSSLISMIFFKIL